ncbi:MAG: hypothetical protein ACHQYR_02905 [Candidatus Gagatemarchaeaceae archaeon]
MTVVVFEDDELAGFGPLVAMRHASQLAWGTRTLLESILLQVSDPAGHHLWGREGLADVAREELRTSYNEPVHGQVQFVNALARPGRSIRSLFERKGPFAAFSGDRLVAARNDASALPPGVLARGGVAKAMKGAERLDVPSESLLRGYWELVKSNGLAIAEQAKHFEHPPALPTNAALRGPPSNLRLHGDAEVEEFVHFDARKGPIMIEEGALVESFSRVTGPCYIGPRTRLYSAQIGGGTSIFEGCRVGGQVDNSILMAHTNKAHQGYVGDSYVGEWVNIGAGSNFSNLKNTYGNVRLEVGGEKVDSGMMKLGPAVGDLGKLSIGTLVYAGKTLGTGCQLAGLARTNVPSFTYLAPTGKMTELLVDSVVETQRRMVERRGKTLTRAGEALLRTTFRLTSAERKKAGVRKGRLA